MKKIVIIGASGHGGMILDCLKNEGLYNVLGFVDSFRKKGEKQYGYEILGSVEDLPRLMDKFNLYGCIIAIGDNWTRKIIADKIGNIASGLEFISTIHPKAVVGLNVQIGNGTVIMPGAIVNANSKIGDFCILNTKSSLGHDGIMNNYSSIASGVCTGGNLLLGEFSAISLGTNIINNITIGEHTVVGAGSLVIKNVEDHLVVFGSPARTIRKRKKGEKYLSDGTKIPDVLPLNPGYPNY